MRCLDKDDSRRRWLELRDLWNAFDPIGVMDGPDSPQDEYEGYLGGCMRLLEQNAETGQLKAKVREAIDRMGLTVPDAEIERFALQMQDWYQVHWPDTSV